jgi:hypothetical protein
MKHVSVKITDVVKLCINCDGSIEQELILDEEQAKRLGHMLLTLEPGGFDIA